MINVNRIVPLLFVFVALQSCQDVKREKNKSLSHFYFPYSFGDSFYCVPLDDFASAPTTKVGKELMIGRRTFSRSDALLVEGGATDRVRFFSGNGSIALSWSIPKGHGYYLRVLKCSDIFNGSKSIRGFGVYARRS